MRPPPNREPGDDRTTSYIIETLGDDIDKAYKRLSKDWEKPDAEGMFPYDETDAREFVRAAFAAIEGISFSIRIWCAARLLREKRMSEQERMMVAEVAIDLRDGKIVERNAKITLEENVKFTFALLDRFYRKRKPTLDVGKEWWSGFKKSVRVRDRLMHPRWPSDLDISPEEVVGITATEGGFREMLSQYRTPGGTKKRIRTAKKSGKSRPTPRK